MKTNVRKGVVQRTAIIIAACLLVTSSLHTQAIEGLKLSLQCSNVVLCWPCLDDGSESFIVQYRQTLETNTPWQTLTSSLTAPYGTNIASFVHSNVVQNPNCGGGSFAAMAESEVGNISATTISAPQMDFFEWGVPLATRADGTGSIVPLALYPPGFDLSDFLIFDPAVSDWLKGSEFSRDAVTMDGPLDPEGGGSGDGGTNAAPETGFYRVVRIGPNLIGITNDMTLSGVLHIPVEVGSPDGQLVTVTLTEDGSPVGEDSIHVSPFELPVPLVTLDTTRMSNGVHEIAAIARWQIGGSTNEEVGGFFEADCPPILIVVSNEISFENWMPYFGQLDNTLLISAQSAHTDTDWWIDIYGATAGYIGTFSGHTFDGSIYGWWDLTGPPPNYIQYTNEPWFQFKVSTPYVDPPSPKTYKQTDPWPSPGGWVIVAQHAFDNILDHETLYEEIDGFVMWAQSSGYTVRPDPVSGSAFPIRFRETGADGDWAAFRQALYHPLSRNLVYFGHGGPNGLGYDQSNTNRSILASEIATRLATIPQGLTNRHGYRMVILDGCSTAAGTLPESFGIIHKENVPGIDYANASLRPSAFAGWTAYKWVGFLNGAAINYDHVNFMIHIQQEPANGNGLRGAIDAAGRYPDVHFVNTSQMKVFGLADLTFSAYNN